MKELTIELVKNCSSRSEICRKIGMQINGRSMHTINKFIKDNDIDINHFRSNVKRKYKLITKECPVCGIEFETKLNHPREKTTCSHACSNTYFRSGENNGMFEHTRKKGLFGSAHYRTICFMHHKKECVVCGEDKIVEVHHMDENKSNTDPRNLVPLCSTHHRYWHSRYRKLIKDKVMNYVEKLEGNLL